MQERIEKMQRVFERIDALSAEELAAMPEEELRELEAGVSVARELWQSARERLVRISAERDRRANERELELLIAKHGPDLLKRAAERAQKLAVDGVASGAATPKI